MYSNSNTAVESIRWWKLLLLDFMEKEMMQKMLPMMPVMAITTWMEKMVTVFLREGFKINESQDILTEEI